jgi:hypothetical protein
MAARIEPAQWVEKLKISNNKVMYYLSVETSLVTKARPMNLYLGEPTFQPTLRPQETSSRT